MKFKNLLGYLPALALSAMIPASAVAQVTFNVDAGRRGAAIGDLHYGIFFEEINHAGDGGLYAELIKNRSFEDNSTNPDAWSAINGASLSLATGKGMLNDAQGYALNVKFAAAGDGVSNTGFWGINVVEGNEYKLSFWAKSDAAYDGKLTASLVDTNGNSLGLVAVPVKAGSKWAKYTASFTATGSCTTASFSLCSDRSGSLTLDVVSLFPPTYKGRENGCRIDLAEKLEAMKPSFVRFPGGCFVEGQARDGNYNRFEWKKTIGGIETRPGHWNVNWNYRVSDGLGFHEMLQLTEDIGAEPLFVVNVGMGHGWTIDYREIDEYIQEALDAIEYCNGDLTTKWGKVRAENGHPEPFGIRLIEVGNENYQADANQQSDHYAERYRAFYDAIKAQYPDILIIGNVEAWGTDNPSWRNNHPVDAVDEHYYRNPAWFASNYNKYDAYDRKNPKVYAGEYAVTSDFGTTGSLRAALGEAIYMLGMERNSDICVMNSYAPIFVNENDQKWMPDMIRFNSSESYGTPSYYVQKLFPNNVGKENVTWTEVGNLGSANRHIGFSSWSTMVKYDNVKISDIDGNVLYTEDFTKKPSDWTISSNWVINAGELVQSNGSAQGGVVYSNYETPDNFIFEFDATKTSGAEGFLIAFNYGSEKDYIWWNIGGWGNGAHAIEVCNNGSKTEYGRVSGSIETGHTYHGKIVVVDGYVRCYLDDKLINEVQLPVDRKLYMSANIDDATSTLYCKLVNFDADDQKVNLNLANAKFVSAEATILTGNSSEAENTTANKYNVEPKSTSVTIASDALSTFDVPAHSLVIVKYALSGINRVAGAPLTPAVLAEIKASMKSVSSRLAHLRSHCKLPTATNDGLSIEWSLRNEISGVQLITSAWSAMLEVSAAEKGDSEKAAGTLVATITSSNGDTGTIEFPITLAPADGHYGYLYCYMSNNKEITNYALGTKADKGRVFNHLLGGGEIFDTEALAGIEHGTRDAYMHPGERSGEYFMTTTDMCNAKSGVWNNSGIDLLRSSDMIHWESSVFDFRKGKSIFSDPDATTDLYKTDAEYAKINRVWAPQFIWDPTAFNGEGAYLVYYSVLSSNSGDNHDRIVYSYADKDFKTLTQPRVFYDPGFSVIDGDILYNEYTGLYHMWLKHEGAGSGERGVYELTSPTLVGGEWTQIFHITNEGNELTEGSSMVRRIDEDDFNVYYMRYTGGMAYRVCEADHEGLNVSGYATLDGTGAFQHGSIFAIGEIEYKMLANWDELLSCVDWAKSTGSSIFTDAIAQAEEALKLTNVEALADAFEAALDTFAKAKADYYKQVVDAAQNGDITALLANPDFNNNNGSGWSGTSFTAASAGVAEHWNKTFDTYQVLESMPAGYYTLECSGFYRNGGKEAYNLHVDGSEELLAELYVNDSAAPFMSLYVDGTSYTGSPYTFPDNVSQANSAFNSKNYYAKNFVTFHLENTGDLRVGIRKTELKGSDWTCFDNFKLYYSVDGAGVNNIIADNNELVDVYSISGIQLRSDVSRSEAANGLTPGVYVIGGKKVTIL